MLAGLGNIFVVSQKTFLVTLKEVSLVFFKAKPVCIIVNENQVVQPFCNKHFTTNRMSKKYVSTYIKVKHLQEGLHALISL
jgi:hypothetical protein